MGLHYLEDEEAVSVDLTPLDQLALEIRIALGDEWRIELRCLRRRKAKLLELVAFASVSKSRQFAYAPSESGDCLLRQRPDRLD